MVSSSKQTHGHVSLTAMTLTKVVFPEFCNPTRVSSISSFQKRLLIQSSSRLIAASILSQQSVTLRLKGSDDQEDDAMKEGDGVSLSLFRVTGQSQRQDHRESGVWIRDRVHDVMEKREKRRRRRWAEMNGW